MLTGVPFRAYGVAGILAEEAVRTVALNDGTKVVANPREPTQPWRFANRTQAERRAKEVGGEVRAPRGLGRAWYILPPKGVSESALYGAERPKKKSFAGFRAAGKKLAASIGARVAPKPGT